MDIKYSEELKYAIEEAKNIAIHYRSQSVGVEHIMVALLKYDQYSEMQQLFDIFKINKVSVRTKLEEMMENNEYKSDVSAENIKLNIQAENGTCVTEVKLFTENLRSNVQESACD